MNKIQEAAILNAIVNLKLAAIIDPYLNGILDELMAYAKVVGLEMS